VKYYRRRFKARWILSSGCTIALLSGDQDGSVGGGGGEGEGEGWRDQALDWTDYTVELRFCWAGLQRIIGVEITRWFWLFRIYWNKM
jgi:hypothetical protein